MRWSSVYCRRYDLGADSRRWSTRQFWAAPNASLAATSRGTRRADGLAVASDAARPPLPRVSKFLASPIPATLRVLRRIEKRTDVHDAHQPRRANLGMAPYSTSLMLPLSSVVQGRGRG